MDIQQQRLWELAQGSSDTTEGTVLDVDWAAGLALVDMNGVTVEMRWEGPAPWDGDRVRIVKAGQKPVCALIMGSPMGTLQTVSSGYATILGDDGQTYRYPYLGAAPTLAAPRVRLDHAGRVVLSGGYSAEPEGSDFVRPSAPPKPSAREAWFAPKWSGNWREGSYQNSGVEVSDSRTGAYGYGKQIRDTVPNGATILVARLYLSLEWDNVPGVASSLGVHGFDQRPTSFSDANLSGGGAVSGTTVALPGGVISALVGGSAFGVGFRSGNGWRRYKPAPGSGRIYMKWS